MRTCLTLFALLVTFAIQASDPLATWHWRAPLPQGNSLRGVAGTAGLYVTVGDAGTILRSTNTLDWQVIDPPTTTNLNAICFATNRFVAVGDGGTVFTSANGLQWTRRTVPLTNHLHSVVFANGLFVAVGDAGALMTSTDGNAWIARNSQLGSNAVINEICFGNGRFAAIARVLNYDYIVTTVITSTDGINWTASGPLAVVDTIAFGNGKFLASGSVFVISSDGVQWSTYYLGIQTNATDLAFTDGTFVAANSGRILLSTNGTNWTAAGGATSPASLRALGFAGGQGIAVGDAGQIITSANLTNWVAASSGPSRHLEGLTCGRGMFVGVGNGILTSADGHTWTEQTNRPSAFLQSVAYGKNLFVAVGRGFRPATNLISSDAIQWSSLRLPTTNDLYDIVFADGRFVAVGDLGTVCDSSDGTNWFVHYIAPGPGLDAITHGGGRFLASGVGGVYFSDDLQTWTRSGGSNVNWYGTAYGNGMFVAVGVKQYGQSNSNVMRSFDGITWEPSAESRYFADLAFGRGTFLGVTSDGIMTSTNGLQWVLQTNPIVSLAHSVTFGRETFVVSKYGGGILQSDEIFPLPRLGSPRLLGGEVLLPLVSGGTGVLYSLEASSNLIEWTNVTTFTAPQFPFTITNPASTPARFHRIISP